MPTSGSTLKSWHPGGRCCAYLVYPLWMLQTGNPRIDNSTADWVIGTDEAGYGTLAGHLVVVGVRVSRTWRDPQVTDSKRLTRPGAREAIVRQYRGAVTWKGVTVSASSIDQVGAWKALIQAHKEVHEFLEQQLLEELPEATSLHVVDGLTNAHLGPGLIPLPKADSLVPAVSLASCFAKVAQCALMNSADTQFPGYGFAKHRGYDTPQHRAALEKLGVCPIHRRSYATIKRLIEPSLQDLLE